MYKQLLSDMIECLERENSKLLAMPYDEIIRDKILYNLETIKLIQSNNVKGIELNV